MRQATLGLGFFLTVLGAEAAPAAPVPAIDVPAMTRASDLIVVGRAARVRVQALRTPLGGFSISVERAIKGTPASAGALDVQLDLSRPGSRPVAERQYGIYFLRRSSGGGYVVTDPDHPAIVASPNRDLRGPQPPSALGRVAQELVHVLSAPTEVLTDPVTGVQRLGSGSAGEQVQFVYHDASVALRTIPFQIAGPLLRAALASGETMTRLWATDALLHTARSPSLDALKLRSLDSVKATLLAPGSEIAVTVKFLANSIRGHIKPPEAAPVMAALLKSTQVEVRRAAADVLSDIATPAVISPLAKLALNDEDQDVRYYAVLGLETATGTDNAPTRDDFAHNEAAVLGHWRTWARTNVR